VTLNTVHKNEFRERDYQDDTLFRTQLPRK